VVTEVSNPILDDVLALIRDSTDDGDRQLLADFAQAYLRRLPPGDDRTPAEWLEETKRVFEFIRVRDEPISVRVSNPENSDGTVIEIHVQDSPFLLDSITNEVTAHGLEVARVTHPVIGVERDDEGRLISIGHARHARHKESVEYYELDRKLFEGDLPGFEKALRAVLTDVRHAVDHFYPIMDRINRMVDLARQAAGFFPEADIGEAIAFLQWLRDNNFVFLGYREYSLINLDGQQAVQAVPDTGLGILSGPSRVDQPVPLSELGPEVSARYTKGDLLVITKTNRLSTVHRRVKLDYIGVRIIGPSGASIGEARLLGLFTSKALMERSSHIPILRRKLADLVAAEDLIEGSHDHKAAIEIFDGFSKHDLFTAPTKELRRQVMGLLAHQETSQVQLFVRRDLLERSVSILVAMPRDRFNAELRKALQELFMARYQGLSVDYHLELGEGDQARIHFTVWVNGPIPEVNYKQLEEDVLDLTRTWTDRLNERLAEEEAALDANWGDRFPDYYRVSSSLEGAAEDVRALDSLAQAERPFRVGIRNEREAGEDLTRVLMYRSDGKQPLSELVPALEDLGLRVIEEVPTRLSGGGDFFIHDFGVASRDGQMLDLQNCQKRVVNALTAVWSGEAESDELNELVITAGLTHWEVGILRAYRVYWRRLALAFTVGYVNDVLNLFPDLAARLIALFRARFDPGQTDVDPQPIRDEIVSALDAIPSIDHDRILRSFYRLIEATLRTNAFLPERVDLAFKLNSAAVPDMPQPVPFAEIFVYGPGVEGVHLRGGPVARGGLRWSDRREDYRTEVLGLMKAQITKNAVIVPTGAKGGFVLRRPPSDPTQIPAAVRSRYESYIRALLDVTDNLVEGQVVHPENVRVHDGEDPYLVVAADRGTATFSDLANSIAAEYDFWLDDAFASGGSAGYDHKALGITARGAWESLRRHFLELGIDPFQQPFTVIGVGDMSGDVFGNGLLGSNQMKLVAAFDHRHIFIDPNPNPLATFEERKRLFDLPRSSWDDFDRSVMSEGGGVFPRSLKKITLSPQAQKALGVKQAEWVPNQLLRAVLLAPVDLFWNGGIGTYVKASDEPNEDVGDRANDAIRVNGSELRCRVVVEGGNLGFTQAGRIEYAMAGGKLNTDFIDNSGGVNCSDREVNLKILLRLASERQGLTRAKRDELVAAAAPEVVERILYDNFQQAQMISQEEGAATRRVWAHEQLMVLLESEGILDRQLEGLPTTEALAERGRLGRGLTRPEIAVLLVDAKRSIYESLVRSTLVDDEYLVNDLLSYFPETISSLYEELLLDHPLRRELIATIVSNDVVNSMGATFVSRIAARSGNTVAEIVKAYRVARDVSGALPRWEAVEALAGKIPNDLWLELMTGADRVVAALTRRYLVRLPADTVGEGVAADMAGFSDFEDALPDSGPKEWQQAHEKEEYEMSEAGVPPDLARRYAYRRQLVHAPDAIVLANQFDRDVSEVAEVMFGAGQAVGLDRLEEMAAGYNFTDGWQRWALEALEDDMVGIRRQLTERVLEKAGNDTPAEAIARFLDAQDAPLRRLDHFLDNLGDGQPDNLAPLMIGVRQLRSMIG
jgi:glutamate dehydrogenase